MMTKLQSIDTERLGLEEGSRVDTWISLGEISRIEGVDGLTGGTWGQEQEDQMLYRDRAEGQNAGRGSWT